ncbi:CPBP family intramembrane glutamic endopeptidase [Peribacillus frigoritolerans]|uniref:CPBP family intramembrane glutamic endopeptidase n=1 Tax=Peribacillus frigoritolerans TaxID=450367 RepID=UPI00105A41A2|nr:type II CAAX endopeptidase family protein [Peribacillus frigoritolerans]TDL80558.1 CPBP family intramembrane metalloprotease [Peribacillus frigoritolerans]
MLGYSLLLLGPAIMIAFGLHAMKSVPLTFSLFYGWLLLFSASSIRQSLQFLRNNALLNKGVLTGFGTGILFLFLIFGTVSAFSDSFFDAEKLQQQLIDWNFTGGHLIWLILILLIVNPLLEEYYWREFMYTKLMQKLSVLKTILITSFFYSLYHLLSLIFLFNWPINLLAVIPVFLAGMIWGYFRHRFRSLVPAILCHMLSDLGIILVYLKFFHV